MARYIVLLLCLPVFIFPEDKTVELWNQVEFTYTSEKCYDNPFLDVDLTAVFVNSGDTIKRPAFWDGSNTWKIRFAPTKAGRWEYRLFSNITGDPAFNDSGYINAVDYNGSLPVMKNGFVKISADSRSFSYKNDSPFFYLADTHWFVQLEKWDECNAPGCESQFKFIADKRAEQGFTVYQVQTNGTRLVEDSVTSIDIDAFRDIDRKFDYLVKKGFIINTAIGSAHSYALRLGIKGAERLAKYWVARYGAYPVIWMTGQEVDIDKHKYFDVWKAAAVTINKYDDYNHPHSAHLWDNSNASLFDKDSWHNFHMIQGGHIIWGGGTQTKDFYRNYWEHSPAKPMLESEANYEELGKDKKCTTADIRNAAYKSILCGSFGFGYGAQGIWENCYTETDCGCCPDYGTKYWYDALLMNGGYQMGYLKKFFTSLNWNSIMPRFNYPEWIDIKAPTDKEKEKAVLSTISNRTYILYLYSENAFPVTLKNLDENLNYNARWFNPVNGEYSNINDLPGSGSSEWGIPVKPSQGDYILLLEGK